jgi:hypothetical protein
MTRATPLHFLAPHAIFEKFIAPLGFHRRKLRICKAAHEIMPRGGMENTLWCPWGMHRPCAEEGGACPATRGRKYLGGIPDATVEILGKSYDAGIPRELAWCHHMGPVGCGKSLGAFRIGLP